MRRLVVPVMMVIAIGCAPRARMPRPDPTFAPLLEKLSLDPDDVSSRLALAEARRSAGDHEGALIEVYKALASDAHAADAHVLRARIYFDRGLVEREIEAWESALAISDRDDLRENLAHALLAAGRVSEAEAEYRAVLVTRPSAKAALWNLALLAEDGGKREEAKRLWVRYLEVDPTGPWAERARSALEEKP